MSISKAISAAIIAMGFFFPCVYAAQEEGMSLKLETIEQIKSQEIGTDELFFSVTEFPVGKLPRHYQIPGYPSHWLSRYLGKIKNVVLWQKDFKTCENVDVVVSLVEQDLAPWDIDDLLGSVKLKVRCEGGKYQTTWEIPNTKITEQLKVNESGFSFTGKKANYRAVFKLEESKDKLLGLPPYPTKPSADNEHPMPL